MRIFLTLLSLLILLQSTRGDTVSVPSPDKSLRVDYEAAKDDPEGNAYTQTAKLYRGTQCLWTFTTKGRAVSFAWSPDSHHLLFGVTLPDRSMALYALDARKEHPLEKNLELGVVRSKVQESLPPRKSGAFALRSQIDFDAIRWSGPDRCTLRYIFRWDRKAGDAVLSLDLGASPPKLLIGNIDPKPE